MQPLETQTPSAFDYAALDAETRIVLQRKTSEIRERMRLTARGVVEIGERLIAVQQLLAHGQWEAWLRSEFAWSGQTARRYIHVARTFGGKQHLVAFAPSALYALAAPSTPETAREEALARAEAGEAITHTLAREIIAQHQPEPVIEQQNVNGTAQEVRGSERQKQPSGAKAPPALDALPSPSTLEEQANAGRQEATGGIRQLSKRQSDDGTAREVRGGAGQTQQIVEFGRDDNRGPELSRAALGWRLDEQGAAPGAARDAAGIEEASGEWREAVGGFPQGSAGQIQQIVEFGRDDNRGPELSGAAALGQRLDQQGTAVGAPLQAPARPPCENCSGRATSRRLIGGVLAWRCDECARLDAQMERLGLGASASAPDAWTHWVALGRILAREEAALYAVQLLRTLAPLIVQTHTCNDEKLRGAIARLNTCEAGSEAAHWLALGWALLDVEPPDDAAGAASLSERR